MVSWLKLIVIVIAVICCLVDITRAEEDPGGNETHAVEPVPAAVEDSPANLVESQSDPQQNADTPSELSEPEAKTEFKVAESVSSHQSTQCENKPPSEPQCRVNEVYQSCGTACPRHCNSPTNIRCTRQCVPGCFCKQGFVLDSKNRCILLRECPKRHGPRENDPWNNDSRLSFIYVKAKNISTVLWQSIRNTILKLLYEFQYSDKHLQ